MISRAVKIVLAAASVVALACVDIASPTDRPTSISLMQVPEFFVVVNDVMRDTLGVPTAPGLIGFDGADQPIAGLTPQFFITDSVKFAHINGTGVIAGDQLGTAHALGQIGNLQTPSTPIYVTVAPVKLANTATQDSIVLVAGLDSASSLAQLSLSAMLQGAPVNGTTPAVGGGIVFYKIVSAPQSKPGTTAVYLTDGAGTLTSVDTGQADGIVSRTLIINSRQLSDSTLIVGPTKDSVVVMAHITYKNTALAVRYVIRIIAQKF